MERKIWSESESVYEMENEREMESVSRHKHSVCVRERERGAVTHGLVRSCDQLRAKETEENCSEFPLSSPSITTHRHMHAHSHSHSHTRTLTLIISIPKPAEVLFRVRPSRYTRLSKLSPHNNTFTSLPPPQHNTHPHTHLHLRTFAKTLPLKYTSHTHAHMNLHTQP